MSIIYSPSEWGVKLDPDDIGPYLQYMFDRHDGVDLPDGEHCLRTGVTVYARGYRYLAAKNRATIYCHANIDFVGGGGEIKIHNMEFIYTWPKREGNAVETFELYWNK